MKHVFVLGAGASAESAGTPLGKHLVWNYYRDCCDLLPDINGKLDHSEENARFSNFPKFLELAASVFPEFAGLPELWKEERREVFLNLYTKLSKKRYIDEMLELLQKQGNKDGAELVRMLIFEHIAEASFDSPNKLYSRFVKDILGSKSPQTASIISLNFDCMLRDDFDHHVYFDYLIEFYWVDLNRAEFYRRSNPISLIKLNGSLDWGMCENCRTLHLYYPFMHRTCYEDKACVKQQCGGRVTPFMVIPHDKHGERINPLWDAARAHLKDSGIVTIIGYSFPEYDKKVIDLFRDSLDTDVRLEVVDYCRNSRNRDRTMYSIKKKYLELFPDIKQDVEVSLDGFSGYLDCYDKLKSC